MTLRAVQCAPEAPYIDLRDKTDAEIDAMCAGYPSPQEYERRRRRDAAFDRASGIAIKVISLALAALIVGLFYAPRETASIVSFMLGFGL